MHGEGYGYGGELWYSRDGEAKLQYNPAIGQRVPIYGSGLHDLWAYFYQTDVSGHKYLSAQKHYVNLNLVYAAPVAPTLSPIGSTWSPNYRPVVSWNDIQFWAVRQNTTNGYEIYRRDYQGEVLWHDWTLVASVSGTTTTWTDASLHGAPMGLDRVDYKVRARNIDGQVSPFSNVCTTKVFFMYKALASGVPDQFSLKEGYPNPFNPTTHLRFDLPAAGNVSLRILDVQGREVKSLHVGYTEAGYYEVSWNAAGQATGIYFARLIVTDESGKVAFTKTNKLLLTK
jgi:hypothetical protein